MKQIFICFHNISKSEGGEIYEELEKTCCKAQTEINVNLIFVLGQTTRFRAVIL